MLNVTDPTIKRFTDNVHNSVERRNRKKLSTTTDYGDFIFENRLIEFFCEDPLIEPRHCAELLNSCHGYSVNGERVIQTLRALHLSYQSKRAELFDWAAQTAEAFVKALESHSPKDFEDFIALRDNKITDREGDPFKIQIRVLCLMLYVKYPELFKGDDLAVVEMFGNAHMKYLFFDVTDFLRNICIEHRRGKQKTSPIDTLTLKDFLELLYAEYPALAVDAALIEGLDLISLRQFLSEHATDDSTLGVTVEEFLLNDPAADSLLISLPHAEPVTDD